ncbi:MAG: VWA domain-containing protein, partial [Myxococcota bacterium]
MISLAGLSAVWMWGLALVGASVISILYLLRLRRRSVQIPFLPLWAKVIKRKQHQSLWERFRRLFSWFLQLLLWAILLFALGDPRLREELMRGRATVLILDLSASMKAREGSKTRLTLAKEVAKAKIQSMFGRDRMMIVGMDAEVIPLTSFTEDKQALLRAVEQVAASDTSAHVFEALYLAEDALRERSDTQIVMISDAAFGVRYAALLKPLPAKAAQKKVAQRIRKPSGRSARRGSKRDDREEGRGKSPQGRERVKRERTDAR